MHFKFKSLTSRSCKNAHKENSESIYKPVTPQTPNTTVRSKTAASTNSNQTEKRTISVSDCDYDSEKRSPATYEEKVITIRTCENVLWIISWKATTKYLVGNILNLCMDTLLNKYHWILKRNVLIQNFTEAHLEAQPLVKIHEWALICTFCNFLISSIIVINR